MKGHMKLQIEVPCTSKHLYLPPFTRIDGSMIGGQEIWHLVDIPGCACRIRFTLGDASTNIVAYRDDKDKMFKNDDTTYKWQSTPLEA